MLRATITTSAGQTVTLEGSPSEIGEALSAHGGAPQPVRRGPGRPPKSAANGLMNGAGTALANGMRAANGTPAAKPPKPASPEVARKRALQGQYMAIVRGLAAADKKRVQALAKERGVETGLAEAQKLRAKAGGGSVKKSAPAKGSTKKTVAKK